MGSLLRELAAIGEVKGDATRLGDLSVVASMKEKDEEYQQRSSYLRAHGSFAECTRDESKRTYNARVNSTDTRIARNGVAALSDVDVCWAVVDPIWPSIETDDEFALLRLGTAGQQAIYVTMLYAKEVDNGGLKQFFGNSSGMLWKQVEEGFELLRAERHLELITTVLENFSDAKPAAEQDERRRIIAAFTQEEKSRWRSLEDAIYSDGGFFETLRPFWTRYIQSYPDEFFLPDAY